jgi:TetR/AcrR family transcriptional repressor of mexJK operon
MKAAIKKLPTARGRPVDARKRDQILGAATCLFMEHGFTQTSMDQIAKKSGISKQTLYDRFPDKNALFTAVIEAKCQEYIPADAMRGFDQKNVRHSLYAMGNALFQLIMSDEAIRMYRMMAAEAQHNPKLTRLFYDSGPQQVKRMMVEKMRQLKKTGRLRIKNPEAAKEAFGSLFTGSDMYMRRLLNIGPKPSRREMDAHVRRCVDFFITSHRYTHLSNLLHK